MKLNVRLKSDQVTAVRYAERHDYSINGFVMGTGKTIIGLSLAVRLGAKTLVVCPSFLRLNWAEEIKDRVDGADYHLVANKKQADKPVPDNCKFVITSYSMLKYVERYFTWADLVIADEVHMLKNPKAIRTDLFDKYLYESEVSRFLGLSGTPISNCISEWYQLLNMCCYNPKDTSGASMQFASQFEFGKHFCNTRVTKFGGRRTTKFFGIRNQLELHALLKGKYLPSPPVTFGSDGLPPLVTKDVMISDKADKALLEEFRKNTTQGKDVTAKTAAAVNMVPLAIKYIEGLIAEEVGPIVVFSDHRKPVELITAKIKGAVSIMGGDSMVERAAIIKRFQAGKIPVLVGTIGALGTGVTLTAACNAVLVDFPYVPKDLQQPPKRIHRIGQTKACTFHRLLGSPQAKHIMRILTGKMKAIKRGM